MYLIKLVELGRIWQRLIKALSFVYRVFYQLVELSRIESNCIIRQKIG